MGYMQPTNNAVRRDASPLECSGVFHHGLLVHDIIVGGRSPAPSGSRFTGNGLGQDPRNRPIHGFAAPAHEVVPVFSGGAQLSCRAPSRPPTIEPVGRSGYDGEVIIDGIRAFMTRDWQRARDAKDAYWAERVGRLGPAEALRIADELRRQALLQHPDWPDAASRREDLRHHARMTELFARVDAARGV